MTKKECPDVEVDINMCVQSALVFLGQGEQMIQDRDGFRFFLYHMAPSAVNLAFACELYLKALLAMENNGVAKKTHLLKCLFDLLSDPTKAEIRADYSSVETLQSLDECIATHNNAFVEWRYCYEKSGNPISFEPFSLYRFAVSLYHVYCKKEAPENAE